MTTISIEVPASLHLRNVAGKPVDLALASVPANVLSNILQAGAKVILTNAFNGGGKDVPEAERLAQMQKKMDAWLRGEFVSVEREGGVSAMREAYVDETRARTGQSVAAVEKDMAGLVASTFGEKEKATFGRFLDALAAAIGKARKLDVAETRDKLAAKYARLADEASKRRTAATAKLDVSGISLD